MWWWRRMKKISWTDRVKNREVLQRVEEDRSVLHTIKRKKVKWIGHILCRNCLLKHAVEGKIKERIEVTGRRGRRRCKQLLDGLKEKREYCKLKGKALERTLRRTGFGRGYAPVARQTVMNVEITRWWKMYLFIRTTSTVTENRRNEAVEILDEARFSFRDREKSKDVE